MGQQTESLLVELFVEELPPKALKRLGEAFAALVAQGLKSKALSDEQSNVTSFASPRRLAVHVTHVKSAVPDIRLSTKLMPRSVAFGPDDRPSAALRKRLAKEGFSELADLWPNGFGEDKRLYVASIDQTEWVYLDCMTNGPSLEIGLQLTLRDALSQLPIPKVMQYQLKDGWTSVNFVRPAHGLLALHGTAVVPVTALGLEAGPTTRGHRFEASTDPIAIEHADDYRRALAEQGAVIAGFDERRDEIARQLQAAAAPLGLTPIDDPALLDEVTALVERPNVLLCRFEPEFLDVPAECLILTMKANQKYFPLLDAEGKLTHQFLVVSNIRPADASRVIEGNERVVRPRLADAKFFFDQDRKRTLESRVAGLDKVVYHGKLGSQGERVRRVRAIARDIAQHLGGVDLAAPVDEAAMLAKADLVTDMVGEFPELQGIMGRYYALHEGKAADVAFAIEDHYRPRFAGDELPRNQVGTVLAIADKLETLVGFFGIGQVPTGDKDPFALRRQALGVARLLIEKGLPLELPWLLNRAQAAFDTVPGWTEEDHFSFGFNFEKVADFVFDRLASQLRDQGYSTSEIDAVLALRPSRLADVPARLAAVRAFSGLPEAAALAAANKRVGNILRKASTGVAPHLDEDLLRQPAELALVVALVELRLTSGGDFEHGRYAESLKALACLKEPIDAFFDQVLVNDPDEALRQARLGLLATLHTAMNRVADLSKLAA